MKLYCIAANIVLAVAFGVAGIGFLAGLFLGIAVVLGLQYVRALTFMVA